MGSLPVEQFTHLEIPVSDLQEADIFQIHRARYTGTKAFRNGDPKINWTWVQAGGGESYRDLQGWVVARLLALFKIRNLLSGAAVVHRLALVHILDPVGAGRFSLWKPTYTSQQAAQWSRYANSGYRGSNRAGGSNSQRGEAMDSESQDRSADV